ncbi:MAG TPA: phosphoribosyltransferase family protein [Longimicrobium sp.]|nr:phosphoribosyltransferase family protein [Longimicrobium sp.]
MMTEPRFRDRAHAGRTLAADLREYAGRGDVLVLGLPRGGVPVAFEVAQALDAPLDVFIVRKLGVPGHEELAMGAIATGGVRVLNQPVVDALRIPEQVIDAVAAREQRELERRERAYRDGPAPRVGGRTVILVDDGLATGATMRAAAQALRLQRPARLIIAVPVAAAQTCDQFRSEVDDVVCTTTPEPFYGVGMWYEDFSQTTDAEVHDLLARARRVDQDAGGGEAADGPARPAVERTVEISAGGVVLAGDLVVPAGAAGMVLFAHGSGSSRFSSRNRSVARELNAAGLGTLLVDLLTRDEERVDQHTAHLRFDIGMLAERLVGAVAWLRENEATSGLPIGLFGASTGGGAALVAAARVPDDVAAVVSRGGRPDLAGDALPRVRAPVLLVVGGDDVPVIAMNEVAMSRMTAAEVRLEIVPGASHLFEEPGALEEVARLASEFLLHHLAGR